MGKKCLLSTQTDGVTDTSESIPISQDQQISSDQVLATASQVVVRDDPQGTSQSLTNQSSKQDPILAELQKISQRFGYLEEQAAKDRQVLTGLVSEFGRQGQAVQQLISQTQNTSRVNPVEQNLSLISANQNVMDLPHSAAADRDTINGRTSSVGNHIHSKQHQNASNHTISAGSLFSPATQGPRWQSGNTLASHLCGRGSIPVMAVSGKAGSCLPLVGSLQYRTLANYMYWFPLPFQLPVVI